MKKFCIFCFSIILGSWCCGQAHYSLDTNNILIGEQTTLTISGLQQYPSSQALSQNDILALEQWFDTVDGITRQRTTITSFEEGEHILKLSETDSLVLIVSDVSNIDTAKFEIHDIAPILSEPYTFWEIFRWVLLVILLIAVGFGIYYVIKRMKNRDAEIPMPKPTPIAAHQQALEDLEKLRLQQLWQQGKQKEYHTKLTDILRVYFEYRFGFNSTEMTSDQTIEAFESCGVSDSDVAALRQILQTADMVKFAKSEPLPYEHDRSMNEAKQLVVNTIPSEPQPSENQQ